MGDDFFHWAQDNPDYIEVPNQLSQVKMLLRGRVDAIVIEEEILYWYGNDMVETLSRDASPFCIFPIFPQHERRIACWDPTLIEKHNQGISLMRSLGEDNAIVEAFR